MPHDHPDAAIVARIQAGDEAALEAIFHQLYATLVGYAARSLRDDEAAEDVVQTVFVELWHRRGTFAPVSGVRPYLFSAVRYRVRDRRRSDRRAERYAGQYDNEFADVSPQQALESNERSATIRAALAMLAPRAREALILVRDHGLSYKDAALVMGVSVNTVKTLLARAVAALRQLIGPLLTLLVIGAY